MRVLKYAILGLLDDRDMSGYDLMNQFKAKEIGHFWSAKHSQIYPELKKLTEEGLIQYKTAIQGQKLEKKIYSITPSGKKELHHWLTELSEVPDTNKDEFMLKAYFFSSMSHDEAKKQFTNQYEKRKLKLSFLEEKLDELEKKMNNSISPSSPYFGHYLVLTRAIERESGYISWLQKALKWMEQ
jgi:DNA-binding PadR family transcriptional regulator